MNNDQSNPESTNDSCDIMEDNMPKVTNLCSFMRYFSVPSDNIYVYFGMIYHIYIRARDNMIGSLLSQDFEFIEYSKPQKMAQILSREAKDYFSKMADALYDYILSNSNYIGILIFGLYYDWKTFVVMILLYTFYFCTFKMYSNKFNQLQKYFGDVKTASIALMTSFIGNIHIIKSFTSEQEFINRFQSSIMDTKHVTAKRQYTISFFLGLSVFSLIFCISGLFFATSYSQNYDRNYYYTLFIEHNCTSGNTIHLYNLCGQYYHSLSETCQSYCNEISSFSFIQTSFTLTSRKLVGLILALLSLSLLYSVHTNYTTIRTIFQYSSNFYSVCHHQPNKQLVNNNNKYSISDFNTFSLACEHLIYLFKSAEKPSINDISFSISQGEHICIVGPSGSGKTTFLSLLLRFRSGYEGTITLNNINIKDINSTLYSQMIAYVSHQPQLFMGTIKENIVLCFNKEEINQNEFQEIIELCGLHTLIQKLPNGFNTMVGDSSIKIPTDIACLVCIARALMTHPKMLILDDVLSSFDPQLESQLLTNIYKYMNRNNMCLLTTGQMIHNCTLSDRIYIMESNQFIAKGTYESLQKIDSIYSIYYDTNLPSPTAISSSSSQITGSVKYKGRKDSMITNHKPSRHSNTICILGHKKTVDNDIEQNRRDPTIPLLEIIHNAENHHIYYILIVIFSIIKCTLYPFLINYVKNIFDVCYNDEIFTNDYAVLKSFLYTLLSCFVFFLVFCGCNLGTSLFADSIMASLKIKAVNQILHRDQSYFDSLNDTPYAVACLMVNIFTPIRYYMIWNVPTYTHVILVAITIYILICFTNIYFGLTFVVSTILLIYTDYAIRHNKYKNTRRINRYLFAYTQIFTSFLSNYPSIYNYNLGNAFTSSLVKDLHKTVDIYNKSGINIHSLYYTLEQFIIYLIFPVYLYIGSVFVNHGYITYESLFYCMVCIQFGGFYVRTLLNTVFKDIPTQDASQYLSNLLKYPNKDHKSISSNQFQDIKGAIEFNNVTLRYPEDNPVNVLRHISFSIPAGDMVAFVGDPDCGRDCIVSVLERFYISMGIINIDDKDIRKWSEKLIRNNISVFWRTPVLFEGTVRDNIIMGMNGKGYPTEADIIEVLLMASCFDSIMKLPQKLNTPIREIQDQLSMADKQKICFARALIRRPSFMIFDDPFTMFDNPTQKRFLSSFLEWKQNHACTVLFMSNNMNMLTVCNTIYLMNKGEILASGTHAALLENNDMYRTLFMAQIPSNSS
ncbi:hypothetical protein WA158_008330 [Blastocystis sp. Blastoise]